MATTASTSGEKAGSTKKDPNETPAQKVQREKFEAATKAAAGK